MSFLSRWFAPSHPLDQIRKSLHQERWADVLTLASALDDKLLPESDQLLLKNLVDTASEQLSRINFEEGVASIRANDFRRGMEHLDLARQLVRSVELQKSIDAEFSRIGAMDNHSSMTDVSQLVANNKNSCTSSCCETTEGNSAPVGLASSFDEGTHFELVLTAYPSDMHPRYIELSTLMRQAILLAHEAREQEAFEIFSKIPSCEKTDIYYYELGSLFARNNQYQEAVDTLQQAVTFNPENVLALMTLVDLHMTRKNYSAAENLLKQMLQNDVMPAYCQARFAVISQVQGFTNKAFEYATKALNLGHNDPELMIFVARELESQGRISEAEGVLLAIPVGGGCSGGANVELADFWLRHKKNLQKSLEMFKHKAKSDPTNPLWGYHIARVYLALGWKKEAKQILDNLVNSENVDGTLRNNALQLLNTQI